ncbi:MAG: MBOAT family protein [Deltaproteobacteria bacterium]|nr:MBOAT family protein [Deltaproteobacteria bacterium]
MNVFSTNFIIAVFALLVAYRFAPSRLRGALVCVASVFFVLTQSGPVAFAGLAYAVVTLVTVAAGWWLGGRLAKRQGADANAFLAVSVIVVILPLVAFKIVGAFFPQSIVKMLAATGEGQRLAYLAPLGISYLTFRVLAYLAEIRKGALAPARWWEFVAYVLFWPTMSAGPIERPAPFLTQHRNSPSPTTEDRAVGLARIATGCVKTLVIGALFGRLAGPLTGLETQYGAITFPNLSTWHAWCCVWAYSLHLYLDFSGASDIAIGLARLFGYRIMENFRWPILATNIADFWRRWHISLTSLVTDYVYIPMGGNRLGAKLAARNTLLAMVLVGLWHGLNFHFVVWGLYHGVLLVAYRQWRKVWRERLRVPDHAFVRVAGVLLTFNLVALGWAFFFLPTDAAIDVWLKLFGLEEPGLRLTDYLPILP